MGVRVSPKREAMEGILAAIYGVVGDAEAFPIESAWAAYADWAELKGRTLDDAKGRRKASIVRAFTAWASERRATDMAQVSVMLARDYVKQLRLDGAGNKTIRNKAAELSQIWEALAQTHPQVKNPWKAVRPDDDGSSQRHAAFTPAQVREVLAECERSGHDWYLASMIALYTALRYGDVARLDWSQVDMERRVITVTPRKTRKSSGITVMIPMAEPLYRVLSDAAQSGTRGFVLPEQGVGYHSCHHPVCPFSDILKRCGLDLSVYSFHSWRHTANTRMAEAGVPSATRQMICGWTNDAMARHYDHATHLKELTAAVSQI